MHVCNQEAPGVAGSQKKKKKKRGAEKVKESKIPLLSLMLNSLEIFVKPLAYTCTLTWLKPVNT